jgi:N utilization substance protein A
VTGVYLDESGETKTATVVVPEDQLSLAIGKDGQNARLAAKLTGWRIDIKSAVEAALEAMAKASASQAIKARVVDRPEVFALASSILEERHDGTELSQGELQLLSEMIELVGQAALGVAREERQAEQAVRAARAARMASEDVDLLAEAEAILAETVSEEGRVDATELFGDFLLDSEVTGLASEAEVADEDVISAAAAMIDEVPQVEFEVVEADDMTDLLDIAAGMIDADDSVEEAVLDQPVEAEVETKVEDKESAVESLPSIIETAVEQPKKEKKRLKPVFVDEEAAVDDTDASKRRTDTKSKSRTLEYDENLGQVVARRHRKRSNRKDDWGNLYDDE